MTIQGEKQSFDERVSSEMPSSTLFNSIRQKWTKSALLPLYRLMKPPLNRAKRAPCEVQILSLLKKQQAPLGFEL
jgi:hypothetical protein